MNQTLLTTARWELINRAVGLSSETNETLLALLDKEIGYTAPKIGPVDIDQTPIAPLPPLDASVKVALCVGHSRNGDKGAVAINGLSEWDFNRERAVRVKALLDSMRIKSQVIDYYQGSSYSSSMQWLANHLLRNEFTLAVELHFNAASPSAEGYEYLFWHKSKRGKVLAQTFQAHHGKVFSSAKDRGIEALGDEAHERGTLFVSLTHCPAIILEPFFGSNSKEVAAYMSEKGRSLLEQHYADSIKESIQAIQAHA